MQRIATLVLLMSLATGSQAFAQGRQRRAKPKPASVIGNTTRLPMGTKRNAQLEKAILKTLSGYEPASDESVVRYYYTNVDLNGDGQEDVLVYLSGSYACGSGGCTLLVFSPARGGFRLASDISLVQSSPIVVSDTTSNGWNDLAVFVAGGGIQPGHYVSLKFNSRRYPNNASSAPALRAKVNGKEFFSEDINSGKGGLVLKP
jgi:hypothetical protein